MIPWNHVWYRAVRFLIAATERKQRKCFGNMKTLWNRDTTFISTFLQTLYNQTKFKDIEATTAIHCITVCVVLTLIFLRGAEYPSSMTGGFIWRDICYIYLWITAFYVKRHENMLLCVFTTRVFIYLFIFLLVLFAMQGNVTLQHIVSI